MGTDGEHTKRNIIFEFDEELWYLNASPKARVLNIEMCGITHPDPAYRIYRDNTWDLYVMEYVLHGSGFIHCGGRRCAVHAGDAYLLRRYTEHEYFADKSDPYEKVWINLSGTLVDHLLAAYDLRDPITVRHVDLYRHFLRVRDVTAVRYDAEAAACAVAQLLISFAHSERSEVTRNLAVPNQMIEYIKHNLSAQLSAEDVAAQAGISAAHARRLFRAAFGLTIHQYVHARTLATAKRMLTAGTYSIGEIADQLGYCDDNYFSAVFKKEFGLSPTQFRKSHQSPDGAEDEL